MNLDTLLQRADLWRAGAAAPAAPHLGTGSPELDEQLGGGWPLGALTEILLDHQGIGELQLLLPALARLSRERWQAWVEPPHIPYAPALADAGIDLSRFLWVHARDKERLWAMEQALRSGACGAVLGWPADPDTRSLRRLQLAAEHGSACGFLFRPRRAARHPSPAAVRLELEPGQDRMVLHVLKRRGGWGTGRRLRVRT